MFLNSYNVVAMLFFLRFISKYSLNFFSDHLKKNNNFRAGQTYPSAATPIRRHLGRTQSYDYGQSSAPTNIPSAPIFDTDIITKTTPSLKRQQPITETHTSYQQTTVNN